MVVPYFRAAWSYRGFIRSSITNEFRTRLARSRFGTAWLVLHPLAQVLIFATILSSVLAARLPGVTNSYGYVVYLMSGIVCWNLFSEILSRCVTVFVDNSSLLRKMNFPRIALPFIVVGSALVNNSALMVVVLAALPLLGYMPDAHWLWLPLLITITAMFAAGFGLVLGTLHVFARDIGQIVGVVLQFWFWVTPVVYPASIVPERFREVLEYNPMAPLVAAYHDILVYGKAPGLGVLVTAACAIVMLCLAVLVFRRAAPELVDAL